MIGAPRLRDRELLFGRRRRDHGGAEHLAHLDRGQADAAAGAVHQQHFARLEPAAIDQRMIGGAVAGQKRRALGVVEGRWQRRQLRRRHHGLIGVAAVPHLDDHAVADRDTIGLVDTSTTSPAASIPGVNGSRRLELVLAGRHQHVGKIDARRPGSATRTCPAPAAPRQSFPAQAFGRAEFAADDCASASGGPRLAGAPAPRGSAAAGRCRNTCRSCRERSSASRSRRAPSPRRYWL